MNRQADNRNYQIAQGLAFLTRYRKLSSKDDKAQEEVEYNYGRSFHALGERDVVFFPMRSGIKG